VPALSAPERFFERGSYWRHLRQLRATLEAQRDEYSAAIAEHFPEGTRISRPGGGYFLWIELPEKTDALDLHRRAMKAGISLAPGPMFSATRQFSNFLRINYGHPLSAKALAAVKQVGRLLGCASHRARS